MAVSDQMEMAFNEASIGQDSVSGNDIPIGSLPEEVRDDVPAMLSEGEYVVPADVLRFYGLKFFEDLRSEAKVSLSEMEQNGRMGGEPMSPEEAGPGMEAPAFRDGGVQRAVDAGYPKSPVENANTGLDKYMAAVTTPPEPKPMYRGGMAGYSAGGSVEDLLSDMKHYSDGGPVVNSYAAGGATSYLDELANYPRQSTFDPMNYGLGFSGNLISPAPAYKTAEAIKEDSGVTDPDDPIIKPEEQGDGGENNPHNDGPGPSFNQMGTIGQADYMSQARGMIDYKGPGAMMVNALGKFNLNYAKKQQAKQTAIEDKRNDPYQKEIDAADLNKDIYNNFGSQDPSSKDVDIADAVAAEGESAEGIGGDYTGGPDGYAGEGGPDGYSGGDANSGGDFSGEDFGGAFGYANKGGFISRRKKT